MAINYVEKGLGLHTAIAAAGHWLRQVNQVWVSSNDAAVQAIIDSFDPLPDYKTARIGAVKQEAVTRMQVTFAGITDVHMVEFIAELWSSVRATAKQTTTPMQHIIDIYAAARAGITSIKAATTKAQVDAVVINWPA